MNELTKLNQRARKPGPGDEYLLFFPWVGGPRMSCLVKKWHDQKMIEFFEKIILGFSDQQLVTGLGILVVAFLRFPNGQITIYHFNIAVDIAFFSANVHLITLTVLRKYLLDSSFVKIVRLVLMASLGILLLVARFLTTNWVSE